MRLARVVPIVTAFCLFVQPLCADHVASRRAGIRTDAERVAGRLSELGLAAAEAERQVRSLTSDELAFFSRDLSRVQVVGARQDFFSGDSDNLWYESVAGAGFFAIGMASIFLMVTHKE